MSRNMDEFRRPEDMEMVAVPRWLLHAAVFCAIQVSRTPVHDDGQDILKSSADELLERAPCDVRDLIAQYDCTGDHLEDDEEEGSDEHR
mgnify:CR=1 FL=1